MFLIKKNSNNNILYLFKWILKRFGFLKSILFEFIDRLIYQKQSQFLLHPWSGNRTPFESILFYNRFGRVLFTIKELIALLSNGKIIKKSMSIEGYEEVLTLKKKGDYTYLWPASPFVDEKHNNLTKAFMEKMQSSLALAEKRERHGFNKTKEWDRISILFKEHFFNKEGNLDEENLLQYRANPSTYQKLFNDQFSYVDTKHGYLKSYLKSIDLVLNYHRNAKVIDKELLASVSESYAGGSACLCYRGQRLSEKLLFHTLMVDDIVQNINFDTREHHTIVDIGSGYGGLDRLLSYYIPNACFILIDLPETLLVTSYFMKHNFPNKRIALLSDIEDRLDEFNQLVQEYDFIIVPPSVLEKISDSSVDLVINSASLGFMESEYVNYYLEHTYRTLKPLGHFYSLNKEYSDHWGIGFYEWDFKGKYLTKSMNYNNRFSYAQWLGQKI